MNSIFSCDDQYSIEARFIYVYLCGCQHYKSHGLFYMPIGYISEDLGFEQQKVIDLISCINEKLIFFCHDSKHIFIPHLFHNNILDLSHAGFADFAYTYNKISNIFSYKKSLDSAISSCIEVFPYWFTSFTGFNQKKSNTVNSDDRAYCPHKKIIELYHEVLPELPQVKEWNQSCKNNLQRLWKEDVNRQYLDWWSKFFHDYIRTSDFLMGNVSDFQVNLGWIVKKNNFAKILNGTYRNRSNCQTSQSRHNRKVIEKVKEDTLSFENFFQNDNQGQNYQSDVSLVK